MSDAIIGGAIAAAVGAACYAIVGLWLEHRREESQQLTIVSALIVETAENLITWRGFEKRKLWWTSLFKLEAYDAYKSELFFLHEDVRLNLADAVFRMRDMNTYGQILQQAAAFGQDFNVESMPTPLTVKPLESVNKELRKWRAEHTRTLALRIRRRLRNFISKILKNSGLRHT